MTTPVKKNLPPLKITNNNLVDVIEFIKAKNVVALHTTTACRVFQNISTEEPSLDSLKDRRVIYIDCNAHEGLLGEGEWEWYIKDAIKDVNELGRNSILRDAIINQKAIPNKTYLSLNYGRSKL